MDGTDYQFVMPILVSFLLRIALPNALCTIIQAKTSILILEYSLKFPKIPSFKLFLQETSRSLTTDKI